VVDVLVAVVVVEVVVMSMSGTLAPTVISTPLRSTGTTINLALESGNGTPDISAWYMLASQQSFIALPISDFGNDISTEGYFLCLSSVRYILYSLMKTSLMTPSIWFGPKVNNPE